MFCLKTVCRFSQVNKKEKKTSDILNEKINSDNKCNKHASRISNVNKNTVYYPTFLNNKPKKARPQQTN